MLLSALNAPVCLADPDPRDPAMEGDGGCSVAAAPCVDVKFRVGVPLDAPLEALSPELRSSVVGSRPLVSLSAKDLERIGARQMARWFRLTLRQGTDVESFLVALERLDTVEAAERSPEPAPPPGGP